MNKRTLRLVLGDQLDRRGPSVRDLADRDVVLMVETVGEIRRFPNHKARVLLFLAAMRHFRDDLLETGARVDYLELGQHEHEGLEPALREALVRHQAERLIVTRPGRFDLVGMVRRVAAECAVPLELREDDHFLSDPAEFGAWMQGRKKPVMEHFYRQMRRRTGLLMDGDQPTGGAWNLDRENRKAFGRAGPPLLPTPPQPEMTLHVKAVGAELQSHYADLPGSLENFAWPVTPLQAEVEADSFMRERLPSFGTNQDAMWTGQPFLFHSRLSAALNLKLLDPLDLARRAEIEYRAGRAPLNAVEGFIRQVIGWREYVRGIYWHAMPEYAERNALEAVLPLPDLFWTGQTEMRCLSEVVGQLLEHGYAHHIQRLMVAGLFGLQLGVSPHAMHEWFMALYVDSVEWVTLPNVLGMSQYADGGLLGTKPYAASGRYIQRMSNYCAHCRFSPEKALGDDACPFTTLYWAFLDEHREMFGRNRRMAFQMKNLRNKGEAELESIRERAVWVREEVQKRRL